MRLFKHASIPSLTVDITTSLLPIRPQYQSCPKVPAAMSLALVVTAGLLATQGAGASIIPRSDSTLPLYDHDPNVPADCNLWWNSDDGISCETALLMAGITVADLTRLVS